MTFTVEQIEANASKLSKYKHTVHLNAEIAAMLLDYAAMKRREAEAMDRVAIALREPNSAKAAQVASSLGASPPSQPSTGVPDELRKDIVLLLDAVDGIHGHGATDANCENCDAVNRLSSMLSATPRSP